MTSRSSERSAQATALIRRLAVAALVGLVAVPLACAATVPNAERPAEPANELELHFLDVGQGDAVLIRAPSGRSVLYDGGPDGERLLPLLDSAGVTSLELVIASHNHADHIGGLVEVIERYRPRFVLENGIPHTTRTYERFLRALVAAGSQILEPTRRTIMLDSVRLVILPPPGDPALGQNDNSVGLRVEFGEFSATMFGDAEPRQHDWWLRTHPDWFGPVHVHKASHHGSAIGDTQAMLGVLRPGVVVIGVGADNRYGHPHPDMLALYRDVGAAVYRTDVHGTVRILAREDGTTRIVVSRAPAAEGVPSPPVAGTDRCVDLNDADVEELMRIRHIGPERARQIIRLRESRPFRSVSDVTRVDGIGSARARDIVDEGVACVRDGGPGRRSSVVGSRSCLGAACRCAALLQNKPSIFLPYRSMSSCGTTSTTHSVSPSIRCTSRSPSLIRASS